MQQRDIDYFETKDAIDTHIAGGAPLPSDLINDALIHGVAVPCGPPEAFVVLMVAFIQMTASILLM